MDGARVDGLPCVGGDACSTPLHDAALLLQQQQQHAARDAGMLVTRDGSRKMTSATGAHL